MSIDVKTIEARVKQLENQIQQSIANHNILQGAVAEAKYWLGLATTAATVAATIVPAIAPVATALDTVDGVVNSVVNGVVNEIAPSTPTAPVGVCAPSPTPIAP